MSRPERYLRALARMAEVNTVFAAAVLSVLADRLGLRRLRAFLRGRPRPEPLTGPLALRLALQRLGPTWIKFGQLAASSTGFLPEAYAVELARLLDEVPPEPFAIVRRAIEEDLGAPLEKLFAEFDPVPLAAASIAQVHAARLQDGTDVVLKVQRPGLAEIVERDMHHMRMITRTLETLIPVVRLAHATRQVEDLRTQLGEEMDFGLEAEHMERFSLIQKELGNDDIVVPRLYRAFSTRRVLTMERLYGIKISDFDRIRREVPDSESVLLRGVRAWMQAFALYGFFHGDVHAGNFLLLPGRRIGAPVGHAHEPVPEAEGRERLRHARHERDHAARPLRQLERSAEIVLHLHRDSPRRHPGVRRCRAGGRCQPAAAMASCRKLTTR